MAEVALLVGGAVMVGVLWAIAVGAFLGWLTSY